MPRSEDEAFMRHAIQASAMAADEGDGPFGAALVTGGVLRHVSRNNQVSGGDPLGHAEVVLVHEVLEKFGPAPLLGATVYASGEPCAMCAGALFWVGVTRVVYAASQLEIIAALGGATLPIASRDVVAGAAPHVHVDGPLLGAEAVAVLKRFAERRR